ncbi:MAG TPA: hypothetical protein VF614_14865 [Chthoniobacteraceae bacterium]|jgi:hypothetical protein
MNLFTRASSLFFVAVSSLLAEGADPTELSTLRQQFEAQLAAIHQDVAQKSAVSQKTYLERLEALQRQLAASGDLDGALSIKQERDRITSGSALDPSKRKALPAALQRELARYEQTLAPITQAQAAAERKARELYLAALARLQQQFTQSNELEKAVAVRGARERMEAAAASSTPGIAATPPPPAGTNTLLVSSYYDRLAKGLRGPKRTTPIGSRREGTEFTELPTEGAHLVGVAIKKGDWFGTPIVSALQPIYETRGGRVRGRILGSKADELPLLAEAKPGYVVSEILVSAPGDHVHGVKLVYRKLDVFRQSLLPNDSYESDWLGIELKNKPLRVGDTTRPAIGLCGRAGDWVGSVGLLHAP